MKFFGLLVISLSLTIPALAGAEKLTLAHVAINPSQGMLWVAKDSGILARYGFTADIVLIPGTPRTVQALIAGDLDYAVAGSPAALRARMQGADVVMLAGLNSYPSQRVFVKRDANLQSPKELKGKIIGITAIGSSTDTLARALLSKSGLTPDKDFTLFGTGTTGRVGSDQGLHVRPVVFDQTGPPFLRRQSRVELSPRRRAHGPSHHGDPGNSLAPPAILNAP